MTTISTKYPFVGCMESRQGGRAENQDMAGYIDTPLGLLVVVCDGMGGGPGGRTASQLAVDAILTALQNVAEHTSRHDALRFAIEKANDAIYCMAAENPELMGMGTTIAAIILNEQSAVMAHVGDSRIYQLRKGAIAFRTADHSYVAELVRQGHITEEEARQHPRSNVITKALGIRPQVEAEFDEVPFHTGDRFVLCTDGIWGSMPQPQLVQTLQQKMGLTELTDAVATQVDGLGQQQGGGHDNLTLAVIDTTFASEQKKIKHKAAAQVPVTSVSAASANESDAASTKKKTKRWQQLLVAVMATLCAIVVFMMVMPQTWNNSTVNVVFRSRGTTEGPTGAARDAVSDKSIKEQSQPLAQRTEKDTIAPDTTLPENQDNVSQGVGESLDTPDGTSSIIKEVDQKVIETTSEPPSKQQNKVTKRPKKNRRSWKNNNKSGKRNPKKPRRQKKTNVQPNRVSKYCNVLCNKLLTLNTLNDKEPRAIYVKERLDSDIQKLLKLDNLDKTKVKTVQNMLAIEAKHKRTKECDNHINEIKRAIQEIKKVKNN